MADLIPNPNALGLASPALGPWFHHDTNAPPTLPLPGGDLSVVTTLAVDMEWHTPAITTRSYHVVSATRTSPLQTLRQENGTQAFTNGNLVVLLTLLPEAELRLWNLTQPIPAPDGTAAPPANNPARARVRYLALEVSSVSAIADIQNLRDTDFPVDLSTDDQKAAFVGLSIAGGLSNTAQPTAELLRPGTDSAIAVKNRTGAPLAVNLWCFDYRGRPLDPGAVANWWAFMASTGIWDNLWFDGTAQNIPAVTGTTVALPTVPVTTGRTVHITSAHEGPLSGTLQARLNLTDLTQTIGSAALYQAGAAPTIGLTATPTPDDAPIPRIAVLPLGNYADPTTATPFAGWTGGAFPAEISRDFARVGFLDIEQHVIGLTRADTGQADTRRRISPAPNTAATPVLFDTDAVTGQVMTALSASASAQVMAPVMDLLWGQVTPPADFGIEDLPDTLGYTVLPLAGEGTTSSGGSSANQIVLVHFEAGSLPANGWIRLWSHGLDTESGLRYRQDGGAARVDATGEAYVVLPIPDGTAAPSDPTADPVRLSFDALVIANGQSRYFAEERYTRPATATGSRFALPTLPTTPSGVTLWICEQGAVMARGGGQYASGEALIAVPDNPTGAYALVDLATLDATDISAATLINAAGSGDTLITTQPAFGQTPAGNLSAAPNSATLVNRTRSLFTDVATMGRPAPSQERRELIAVERTGNTAVIGATPGRTKNHEAPPSQFGHAGVPASAEIHGPGISLAGPATDQLVPLMEERRASDLAEFLGNVGAPVTTTPFPAGTNTWAAALETTTHGVVGDGIVRSLIATAGFLPGQTWTNIKGQLNALPGVNIDSLVDTSTFDDDALATAVDRMILKTRDGAKSFANSILAAIGRAEDFIYIETPAIDPHAAESGAIDLIGAISSRWTERPGLCVMLCVPEKFLPNQTAKVEEIRKAGISAALKALLTKAPERVVLFSPIAGPGRRTHMAATTVVVDDTLLLTGSTHLWRRGLTFDSAISVGLFDENVTFGRSTAVRAARLQLVANALGLPPNFLPEDPEDCLVAIRQMNQNGGLGRVKPGAYPAKDDPTSSADLSVWNPDGRPGVVTDWLTFFAALTGGAATDFNSAIR